ncbi:hypothetical protein NBM05_02135 [Rothia sp. AR01]|uniref:Uncharacterized protein n=1 Tax=Rothia santali TaxID=2949643 RepID=A0A9X2HAX6_9MICC|nr:hypothetical protein [Rothia santali]MCP3424860.1 hypothetical protein [Rothia santali]
MTRKISHWRALGIPVLAASAIAAGSIPATNAAPMAPPIDIILDDEEVSVDYDLAIVAPDGSLVQASTEESAYELSAEGNAVIPFHGSGEPEPTTEFDVVTTSDDTGPVRLSIDPQGNDVAAKALYTVRVDDGSPLADHQTLEGLEAHPIVIDGWETAVARTVRIELSLPSDSVDPSLSGGRPIGFTTVLRGETA